jgi:hypothetical protein
MELEVSKPNITLKRDAPFRGGFEDLLFFSFCGFAHPLWRAYPLALRYHYIKCQKELT